jgi:class 3 adenylate cyclase
VVNARWESAGLPRFGLGIGISTGPVAAAILGSEERLEYTLIGDTVNLAQRLQDQARPECRIVLSGTTYDELDDRDDCEALEPLQVKGRTQSVRAYVIDMTGGK